MPKPTKTWKNRERQVAKLLGTERTPLSGSNSKWTASDSLDPVLFVEAKHRKRHSVLTLYDQTAKLAKSEKKIPVVALTEHRRKGVFVLVSLDRKVFKAVLERLKEGETEICTGKEEGISNVWVYHPKYHSLRFYNEVGMPSYEIPMDKFHNSAEVLDWIIQILRKTWAVPTVFRAFVEALDDLLDIQENYCPSGKSKIASPIEQLNKVKPGWRIYPKPKIDYDDNGPMSLSDLSRLVDRDEKEWLDKCDRICREKFGSD